MLRQFSIRTILIRNQRKSLRDAFKDSFVRALKQSRVVDTAYEKASLYKGEFNGYARPYDRYLEEERFREIQRKEVAELHRQQSTESLTK